MAERKTHCVHGHELTPANTRVRMRGKYEIRDCITCRKLRTQRAKQGQVSGLKTHCVKGHEYTELNTYIQHRKDGSSYRRCRVCALGLESIDQLRPKGQLGPTPKPRSGVHRIADVPRRVQPDCAPVMCWCDTRIVIVTQRDLLNGITDSCGRPRCRPPASAAA